MKFNKYSVKFTFKFKICKGILSRVQLKNQKSENRIFAYECTHLNNVQYEITLSTWNIFFELCNTANQAFSCSTEIPQAQMSP